MSGFTDRVSQGILAHITGKTQIFPMPQVYMGVFTTIGLQLDTGAGFTEPPLTGGYARVRTTGADWDTPVGSAPSSTTNLNAFNFSLASADWGAIIAFGLFDAMTSGNLLAWGYLGTFAFQPATINAASPAVITLPAHGYSAGDSVVWSNEYGGTPPLLSQSNFVGPVVVVSPTTDTFTVTNQGTAVNTTTSGNGMVRKVSPQTIVSGQQASFPARSITLISA